LVEEISKIINDWNPAEIYPLLHDEYQCEISKIVELLSSFESKSTISKQIYDLFESCFGNEFRKPYHECEEITEILINIQSSK